MAASNFDACLKLVFVNEGGFSDDIRDPGRATQFGVTQATLSAWRGHPVTPAEVQRLTQAEAAQIYRANYWTPVRGDDLPAGVDLAVMDYAVNSGTRTAIRALQKVVGAEPDGALGPMTLSAVKRGDPATVIRGLSRRRLSMLASLRSWAVFGRGWQARVARTEGAALAMAHAGEGRAAA